MKGKRFVSCFLSRISRPIHCSLLPQAINDYTILPNDFLCQSQSRMEARKGGRAYVKKPESGLGFGKPKAQNSNPSAKGNQAKKGQGPQAASNGGTKKANPIEAANGNGSALKKSKDAQPPAVEKVPVAQVAKEEEQEEEEASCLICCEPIDYFSVGECEHRFVCSQCTLRRRGLYKEMHCCICKVRPIHSPGGSGGDA
jgi:hypothetical protein